MPKKNDKDLSGPPKDLPKKDPDLMDLDKDQPLTLYTKGGSRASDN